ncbi:DUF4062 domain-containing protein [Candidatus Binatia bacterium]|nr:DUF4062 domain-containing protein [Candidatus Binatia bacterium]
MAHRVFLSSTFTDLEDYRRTVQSALRQLGAIDVSMEYFGARDERPAGECVRLVRDESDLFVGIYAHRYGYVPDGARSSISEMEYWAATEAALPRFIYLVDDNQPWLPAHIDAGQSRERLLAFKNALQKRHICQRFGGQDQLATRVVADVGRHIAMQKASAVGPGIPVRDIGLESLRGSVTETTDEWNSRRNSVYENHRDLFLTHVIRPSSKPGQTFDAFIYLIRHKSEDLSDVGVAEFFLGPYWENKVFPAVAQDGFIGISTSAYGTFLCICRVTFTDGSHIYLDRYIDFEMQRTGGSGT